MRQIRDQIIFPGSFFLKNLLVPLHSGLDFRHLRRNFCVLLRKNLRSFPLFVHKPVYHPAYLSNGFCTLALAKKMHSHKYHKYPKHHTSGKHPKYQLLQFP